MKSICINVEMPTQWRCECKEGYRHEEIGWDLRTVDYGLRRTVRCSSVDPDVKVLGEIMRELVIRIYSCMVQIVLTWMNASLVIMIVMSSMVNV